LDPDHHGDRRHDRGAHRGGGGRGARFRPERAGFIPRLGGELERLCGGAGHLAGARGHVCHREPGHRRALRRPRSPHLAGEPRAVSAVAVAAPMRTAGGVWRALRETGPIGLGSAAVILVAVLVTVFGPAIAPQDPYLGQLSNSYVGPQAGAPLGFDGAGRDVLSRVLVGARTSMVGPFFVVLLSLAAATLLGVWTAWVGGRVDAVVSSVLNVLFAFPGILLAILATAVFG